jgi:hypothetical protein
MARAPSPCNELPPAHTHRRRPWIKDSIAPGGRAHRANPALGPATPLREVEIDQVSGERVLIAVAAAAWLEDLGWPGNFWVAGKRYFYHIDAINEDQNV